MTENLRVTALNMAVGFCDAEHYDTAIVVDTAEKFLAFLRGGEEAVAAGEPAAPEYRYFRSTHGGVPGEARWRLGRDGAVEVSGWDPSCFGPEDLVTSEGFAEITAREPRVFASADEIPEDVKMVRMATGEEVVRVERGTGWSYLEPDGTPVVTTGDHWVTFRSAELPVTEVLDD